MTKFISFTAEGLENIKKEKELLLVKRKSAVENLRTAREMGDLSENGAYKAARAELSSIDSRIRHLNYLLHVGRVENTPNTGEIGIGSKIILTQGNKQFEYELVGSFESDPSEGKISDMSPLGKVLMGKTPGAKVTLSTPSGISSYQVSSVK